MRTMFCYLLFVLFIVNNICFGFDINDDGYSDIIFSNNRLDDSYYTDSYIYFGSETGYSESLRQSVPAVGPHGNTVADINQDGFDDIVFCNYTNGETYSLNSYIYYGSTSGLSLSGREELPTNGAMGCGVVDLNFDGYNDLVFSNYRNSSRSTNSFIYYGSSTGYSVSNRDELPTIGARGVSIADLNSDNYYDIVFSNNNDGHSYDLFSYVYYGSSTGYSVDNRDQLPTDGAWGNSVADINKDGFQDIIFSCESGDYSYIYLGSLSGFSIANLIALPTIGSWDNTVADLNGDGYLDIVFSNHYAGPGSPINLDSYIYWGSPDGFSEDNRLSLETLRAHGVVVVDLNGDGYLDIVFSSDATGEDSIVYWGDENHTYTEKTQLPTNNAWGVSAGDSSAYANVIPINPVPEPIGIALFAFGAFFLKYFIKRS